MRLRAISESQYIVEVKTPSDLNKRFQGWFVFADISSEHIRFILTTGKPDDKRSLGHIYLSSTMLENQADNTLDKVWIVTAVEAGVGASAGGSIKSDLKFISNKWGPLLYDIALEYATIDGVGLLPAQTLTIIGKLIHYKSGEERLMPKGNEIDVHYMNTTSDAARRLWQRLYSTGKGLLGHPIRMRSALPYIPPDGTMFSVELLDEPLRSIMTRRVVVDSFKWQEHPAVKELEDEARRDGWDGTGWPQTRRMYQTYINQQIQEAPYMFIVYSKEPYITTILKQQHLLRQ